MGDMREKRFWLIPAVIVVIPILLMVFLAASEDKSIFVSNGNATRQFVSEFQTLIGGIFAIFAAYFTVWQMRTTDSQAERQHAQQMALSIRHDGLTIDRASSPDLQEIDDALEKIEDLMVSLKNPQTGRQLLREEVDLVFGTVEFLSDRLNRPNVKAAEKLFHGDLTEHLQKARDEIEAALNCKRQIVHYNSITRSDDYAYANDYYERELPAIRETFVSVADAARNFRVGLEALGNEYKSVTDALTMKAKY
ncbi:hypothetical protein RHIZ_07800 [Rhizobium skierniewicense]|uniref:hypothetical protein n=1 Tax=Rhizobium skierniewicense TaxID=984260 RepID=UPI001FAC1E82|nr:hypothetical protein [Rhizobium skierniewicense]MCI9865842.1 hypothetical protein [Rhizobium skierniewicense]